MRLWVAMQVAERRRLHAERLHLRAQAGSLEYCRLMSDLERQWLDVAAQGEALFGTREPPNVRPLSTPDCFATRWDGRR